MSETRIRLTGPAATGVRVRASLLRSTLDVLVDAVEQSVRLRVEGRSKASGAKPTWLDRAAAFDVEIQPGSTVLCLRAPPLADALPNRFAQADLFEPVPLDDSAVDVFTHALADALAGEPDSDLYDDGLIDTLLGFGRVFGQGVEAIEVTNGHIRRFDESGIERLRELRRSIPPEQRARVAGKLDALRHSSRTFELELASGESSEPTTSGSSESGTPRLSIRIRGILSHEAGSTSDFGPLLGGRVVVEGSAKFRASGRLLRLDADTLRPAEGDVRMWEQAPRPLFAPLAPLTLRVLQGPRTGLGAIFGKWPGDESEEVASALRELS